ncbi:MAG TPA: carbohydrate ABC transporter permease [Clostridia bacterium]|nr:carbohydrate ABC transporter permease [Clostridia bacterium]
MVTTRNDLAFEIVVTLIILLVGLLCLVPVMYVISASLTPMAEMLKNGGFVLFPHSVSFSAYREVLKDATMMTALSVSARVTLTGTALNLLVTLMLAYPLSRMDLPGRGMITKLIVFTMIFSAGMIPTYLVVKQTGLIDSLFALIIPSLVTVYNLIVMKAFFEGLPMDVLESARIDGAGEFKILLSIVLPLSLPIVATISLYYAVAHWNTYMAAILYLQSNEKMPLQVVLPHHQPGFHQRPQRGRADSDRHAAHGGRRVRNRADCPDLSLHSAVLCQRIPGGRREGLTERIP